MYLFGLIIKNFNNELWLETTNKNNEKKIVFINDKNNIASLYKLGIYVVVKIINNNLEEIMLANDLLACSTTRPTSPRCIFNTNNNKHQNDTSNH